MLNKLMVFLTEFVVLNILLLAFCASTPVFYTVLPFVVLALCSSHVVAAFATIYTFLGPLACAFWMLAICHWPAIHEARLAGRIYQWRQDKGGLGHTLPKSFAFMLLGLFGSVVTEVIGMKILAAGLIVGQVQPGITRLVVFFVFMPFFVFAPVLLTLLLRYLRSKPTTQPATATAQKVDLWGIDPADYAKQYVIDERRKADEKAAREAQWLRELGVRA